MGFSYPPRRRTPTPFPVCCLSSQLNVICFGADDGFRLLPAGRRPMPEGADHREPFARDVFILYLLWPMVAILYRECRPVIRRFHFWICTLLVSIAGMLFPARSQTTSDLTLRQWSIEDGLPQSTVRTMIRTHDGYLWLGTWNGLARFDGVQFHTYSAQNVQAFSSDQIGCLYEDQNGTLWIGTTEGGLIRYSRGIFRRVGDDAGLSDATISSILMMGDGRIYVGSSKGLFRVDSGRVVRDPINSMLAGKEIRQLQTDTLGRLWIRVPGGTFRFTPGEGNARPVFWREIRYVSFLQPDGRMWFEHRPFGLASYDDSAGIVDYGAFHGKNLSSLYVHRGQIWVGTDDGLTRIRDGVRNRYTLMGEVSLANLTWVISDDEGNVWVSGSGKGLIRLREKQVRTYTSGDGLSNNLTNCVVQRDDGTLIVGTEGAGIDIGTHGRFRTFIRGKGNELDNTYALLVDRHRALWIGTWGGGLFRIAGDKLTSYKRSGLFSEDAIVALTEDRSGIIWIGTPKDGLFRFNQGRFSPYPLEGLQEGLYIDCLLGSSSGGLWVGTRGKGLFHIIEGTVERIDLETLLASNFVRAIYEDENGILWVGTTRGLSRIEGSKRFTYSAVNGITDGVISQIVGDDEGSLWYGGLRGIHRMPLSDLNEVARGKRKRLRVHSFGTPDGMLIAEVNGGGGPRAWKDSQGSLWFTTGKGLVRIDPRRQGHSLPPPKALVEEVRVDGNMWDPAGTIVFRPEDSRIEISYTGLSLAAPENIVFRYRLEGFDKDWVEAGHRRQAVYTSLPYGTFQFRVAASNGDEVWSQEARAVRIVVVTPFWLRTWFLALIGALFLLGGPSVYFYRTRQLERRNAAQVDVTMRLLSREEEARKKIAADLHDNLAQKLVLLANRVRRTWKQSGDSGISKELEAIEELARSSLDDVKTTSRELRPLHLEELGLARSLLSLARTVGEATELDLRTEVETSLALRDRTQEINVYRIAQEALNNVVKHSQSETAVLSWTALDGSAVFRLEDNGTGLPSPETRAAGFGFRTMKERARMIGAHLEIRSAENGGTVVELRIPQNNDDH